MADNDNLHKINPGTWPRRQKNALPPEIPPLPALEDLTKEPTAPLVLPYSNDDQADEPTAPLVPPYSDDDQVDEPTERLSERKRRLAQRLSAPEPEVKVVYGEMHGTTPQIQRPRNQKRKRRLSTKLIAALIIVAILGGGIAYGVYYIQKTVFQPLGQFFHPVAGNTSGDGTIDGHAWNLLLLGSDNDDKYTFPEVLTQVMMIIHVDPSNNSVTLVSIPRDSWIPLPNDQGMHKIDQVFFTGSLAHRSFDDAVQLTRQTIEQDYGIPIDRYAWVGLDGFSSVIDTLGGIDIDVTHPILDDNYPDDTGKSASANDPYALKRLFLAPGPQHLDGQDALAYVRSRHADLVGDIGRTQRQQQVIEALKKKLDAPAIFNHLDALFKDLTGKVYTDLNQSEMLSVANFARSLPANNIQRLTLGPGSGSANYGELGQVVDPSDGSLQDVVLPNCANIQPAINRIFGLGDSQSCQITGPTG